MNLFRPIIIGIHGGTLTDSEKIWLPELRPYGVILFSRNVESPSQLRQLCDSIRNFLGDDIAIMIDQEGGRVQRLKDPHWPRLPSALQIGRLWRRHQFKGLEAANSLGQVIGSQLAEVGITHAAAPVLDLLIDGADPIIGDRSFGITPAEIIPLATAFIDGLQRFGITAVVKHIPGMGRVDKDSHDSLPVISTPVSALKESDWVPFRMVRGTHWAMTAHVVIPEWDKKPITQSEQGIKRIRETFGDRVIVSDCLTMGAIEGSIEERVTETLDAGVDLVLFSNGSENERRRAVTASGEPRVTREDPLALSYLPPLVLRQLLKKLAKVDFDRTLTDPTWDRPT